MNSNPQDWADALWYESLVTQFESVGWDCKTDLNRFPSDDSETPPVGEHINLELPETTVLLELTFVEQDLDRIRATLQAPIDPALDIHEPELDKNPFITGLGEAHHSIATRFATPDITPYTDVHSIATVLLTSDMPGDTLDTTLDSLTEIAQAINQLHSRLFTELDVHREDESRSVRDGIRAAFWLDRENL